MLTVDDLPHTEEYACIHTFTYICMRRGSCANPARHRGSHCKSFLNADFWFERRQWGFIGHRVLRSFCESFRFPNHNFRAINSVAYPRINGDELLMPLIIWGVRFPVSLFDGKEETTAWQPVSLVLSTKIILPPKQTNEKKVSHLWLAINRSSGIKFNNPGQLFNESSVKLLELLIYCPGNRGGTLRFQVNFPLRGEI